MQKRQKLLTSIVLVIMSLCIFTGCGEDQAAATAEITDTWKLTEMTVKGKTETNASILGSDTAPKFACSDGTNFVFSNNGQDHSGTLSESDGVYTLSYHDTDSKMEARISGDTLTITIVGGTSTFKFEKQ